jgi:hypothetical protein
MILDYIQTEPLRIISYIVGYALIGVLWSLGKWYYYLKRHVDITMAKLEIAKNKGDEVYEWQNQPPKAKENSNRIITWMSYWPLSAFWTLIDEPFKRFSKFLYRKTSKIFDTMSDKMFANVNKQYEDAVKQTDEQTKNTK